MNIIKRMGLTSMVGVLILSLLGCVTQLPTASSLPQVSVQLWSVKNEVKADLKGTLQALANMGFKGVEFAGEFGEFSDNPTGLKSLLDELGLQVSGAHVHFDKLSDVNLAQTVAFYQAIGCTSLIVPYDERAFSPEGVQQVVNELNTLSKKLEKVGMQIGYHNHAPEFNDFKQSTYWDFIAQSTHQNVILQLDVGWVTYAGKDPVDYVRRYPGRTLTTHYKVRLPKGTKSTKSTKGKLPIIGQDTIDWPALIQANIQVGGTHWLVVEQEEYPNDMTPMQAVEMSKKGLDMYLLKI
jgi:sugar phosphate isomerase/epimerase